jgi:hypothetical protein
VHEHARPGRDNHVKFQCQKLSDFNASLAEVRKTIPNANWQDLCLSSENAYRVNAGAKDYVERRIMDIDMRTGNQWPIDDHDRPYDIMSIMNYPSDLLASKPCWGKMRVVMIILLNVHWLITRLRWTKAGSRTIRRI